MPASFPPDDSDRRRIASGNSLLFVAGLLLAANAAGCARYQMGTRTMFAPDVQTVYVPMFESESLRRNLGERLTEAVVKEIESRTPYKVVGANGADSVLTGRLERDRKRLQVTSPTDEPRMTKVDFRVVVSWVDRRGDMIREETLPMEPQMVELIETGTVVPELGQSVATAQQETIRQMANRIVDLMETPW